MRSASQAERGRPVALVASLAALLALLACGVAPTGKASPAAAPAESTLAAVAALPTSTSRAIATSVPTRTPAPTATPTREAAAPTRSAQAAPPPGPAPDFTQLGEAAANYLTEANGDSAALAAALEQWEMAPRQADVTAFANGPIVSEADMTGDGRPEIIVAAANPKPELVTGEGILVILAHQPGGYAVVYDSVAIEGQVGPAFVLSTSDATGDGLADLAYGLESCGAHTCTVDVRVITYESGSYANLAQGIVVAYPDFIELRDANGDGTAEIIARGGMIASVGAGAQRASTLTYKLVGDSYKLAKVEWEPSDLLFFKIVDANAALATGDLGGAASLYEQAATDEGLVASEMMQNGMTGEEEVEALRSFARFRLAVVQVLAGDTAAAQEATRAALEAGGPYAPVADAFWRTYIAYGDAAAGCDGVAAYVQQTPELLDILNAFGYANPYFTEVDVCQGAGQGAALPETTL